MILTVEKAIEIIENTNKKIAEAKDPILKRSKSSQPKSIEYHYLKGRFDSYLDVLEILGKIGKDVTIKED